MQIDEDVAYTAGTMAPNLDQWLGKHHTIRDSIIWEYPTPLPGSFSLQRAQPYKNWYLPTRMLHDYCTDQAAGKSHADGDVYAGFQWYGYTLTELEWQHRLWSRMDAKIASMGGCDHIDLPTFGPHRHR